MNNVTIYEDREFMIFNVSELNIIDFINFLIKKILFNIVICTKKNFFSA